MKETVSRQLITINKQQTTISRLERELKLSRIAEEDSNPYRIQVETDNRPRGNGLDLVNRINDDYDRILAEIEARQNTLQSHYSASHYDPTLYENFAHFEHEEMKDPTEPALSFKNKCPLGHNLHSDIMSSEEQTQNCDSCMVSIEECGFIWKCPAGCAYMICDKCRFGG